MADHQADDVRLLKVSELADRWGLTPQTVYKWVAAGILPVVRIGNGRRPRIRIDAAAVCSFEVRENRTA